jgi:hypothetical protein
MNAIGKMNDVMAIPAVAHPDLLRIGTEPLQALAHKIGAVAQSLRELDSVGDEATVRQAQKLADGLAAFEPSITLIGQVKAGKTSLVNALTGLPDLLPADVNPWTSVVTSLHLSPSGFPTDVRARFEFFAEDEWSRLVNRGGRIGEMASRAGASDELEKVRAQLNEMREKSKARLGKKFELLLGQTHDYGYFDKPLIERYVCLGDDFETETDGTRAQGRFADITRSADLYIDRPDLPLPLCVRDTPGVNDTFMMREQITIKAIRESRLCVVVLSAHQAMSNVDLALIRLIANVKAREVVIFVNRIDELPDPSAQVKEIRDSIRDTLQRHQGPVDAEIIFGSAYWANRAIAGTLGGMAEASTKSLLGWAEHALKGGTKGRSPELLIWELSGIPALMRALSQRIVEGEGREALDRASRAAQNLVSALKAADGTGGDVPMLRDGARFDRGALIDRLTRIEAANLAALGQRFEKVEADFDRRLARTHANFLERATAALIQHLETHGDEQVWNYDPAGLRLTLRSAYQVFSAGVQRQVQMAYDEAADALRGTWLELFALSEEDFRIEPPTVPRVPPPVQIGQTIALDVKGAWWKRWWQRRRGYSAYAEEFYKMIEAETRPMVDDLRQGAARALHVESSAVLREFLQNQRGLITGFADKAVSGSALPPAQAQALRDRASRIENLSKSLADAAAA